MQHDDDYIDEEELKEQPKNRAQVIQPWQFKKGQSGNPKGRPPGKSLKERAKAMLNAMTPEEEQAFLEGIDKRTIWEMAEGKAEAKTDVYIKELPKPILNVIPTDNSNKQNTVSEETN